MPFGLKNAGSTYQRMMTRMFESQLGKNIEVYIDDMVVKSKVVFEHVGDLGDIFEILSVWANFALGSNSVKGKARPNILYE